MQNFSGLKAKGHYREALSFPSGEVSRKPSRKHVREPTRVLSGDLILRLDSPMYSDLLFKIKDTLAKAVRRTAANDAQTRQKVAGPSHCRRSMKWEVERQNTFHSSVFYAVVLQFLASSPACPL